MKIETVNYQINWRKFHKGCTFFVPCINHKDAKDEIARVMRRFKMRVVMKVSIEDGIKGLRVWRL